MDVYQQIKQQINEARRILICLPRESSLDNAVAGLALNKILRLDQKDTGVVSYNFLAEQNLKFLSNIETIKSSLPVLKQMIISLDLKNTPLGEFSYDVKDERLEIYLEPEAGMFDEKNISTHKADYKYQLIITLGVTNFDSLGPVFHQAPDFFYSTPIINIDHKPNNESFGQINHLDLTSVACSGLIFDLITEIWGEDYLSEEIATHLLTGIISATHGLKSPNLTPQILDKVAKLISLGVDVAVINKNLYHTKSINMLKLWGRTLARLKEDRDLKLVWSLIPYEDFIKTKSSPKTLSPIINELIYTYAQAELILLLWQDQDDLISGLLKTAANLNALDLLSSFNPQGRADLAEFSLGTKNLLEAEQKIIDNIRQRIKA